jgi:hypothetical protein
MATADEIAIVAAAIAFGSAVVSVFAICIPWRNTHDSEVFKEAILALERAYRTLTQNGEVINPPLADRLNWLTAARHLEGYKDLKAALKTGLYKRLCRENEEYWRHQFYLCILKEKIRDVSYFEKGMLEPRSVLVVFGFAAWPNDKEDPIDALDVESLFNASDLLRGCTGLREYLSKFPEYGGETQ